MDSNRSGNEKSVEQTSRRYNPYVFGPPVQDPEFFFGREHELAIIKDTMVALLNW